MASPHAPGRGGPTVGPSIGDEWAVGVDAFPPPPRRGVGRLSGLFSTMNGRFDASPPSPSAAK
eukprot:5529268-Pyramimonas_sp.AAC.1